MATPPGGEHTPAEAKGPSLKDVHQARGSNVRTVEGLAAFGPCRGDVYAVERLFVVALGRADGRVGEPCANGTYRSMSREAYSCREIVQIDALECFLGLPRETFQPPLPPVWCDTERAQTVSTKTLAGDSDRAAGPVVEDVFSGDFLLAGYVRASYQGVR